jgi:hypothetical protein
LGPASLLYSQRFVIHAEAILPSRLKKRDRESDWHLIFRVADEHGKWFDGASYTHLEWKRVPAKVENVIWSIGVFARPGNYQVVLLAFDESSGKHFIWRKLVKVEKPDVLRDLDRNLPVVEFMDSERSVMPVGEYIPIQNRTPVRIDVVLNLTGELQLGLHRDFFSWVRQRYVEGTLQGATGVFSQLQPASGCVRLSAVDILHVDTALDRAIPDPASDWQSVNKAITKNRDVSKVDVRTLAGRTKARRFFHQFLDQVIADPTGCRANSPQTDRAVIVVSDSLNFPKGADSDPVTAPPELRGARFFHVRITSNFVPTYDQVARMLDPLHPRRFDVRSPSELRRAVAAIISDIETAPAQ